MKILVVEDDRDGGAYVKRALGEAGHAVDLANDGRSGLMLAIGEASDVIVLDRMLPSVDGLAILRAMRASSIPTPVLILTAVSGIDDRVEGLEAGADDYLPKPFAMAELLARVQALGRRSPVQQLQTTFRVADLEVDLLKRNVTRRGERIDLQPKEFQLLHYLLRHAGKVVTRTMLLESVWDFHFDPRTNIVDTHISRLRGKLAQGGGEELIHTVRGAGYCLREPD